MCLLLPSITLSNQVGTCAGSSLTSADKKQNPSTYNGQSKVKLRLAGAVGIPEGHASTPSSATFSLYSRSKEHRTGAGAAAFTAHAIMGSPTMSSVSNFSGAHIHRSSTPASLSEDGTNSLGKTLEQWPLQDALQSKRLVLVEDCANLIQDYPIRVWDELPNAAIVVPIANDSDAGVATAVLVIGLSIRRPFDDDYESFIVSCP
jgi:hypothetical protein